MVVTVASIVLSRLPEKLAIILMAANDGYDVAENTIILDSSVRPLDCIGTQSENGEVSKHVMYPSSNETTRSEDVYNTWSFNIVFKVEVF